MNEVRKELATACNPDINGLNINVALEHRSVDKVRKESWSRRLNRILLSLTFRVMFLGCYMCAKINIRVALFVISVCSNDKLP